MVFYQEGKFLRVVPRRNLETELSQDSGFVAHWDSTAHAPYFYNASRNHFFTDLSDLVRSDDF